jgi:hypothetical protein
MLNYLSPVYSSGTGSSGVFFYVLKKRVSPPSFGEEEYIRFYHSGSTNQPNQENRILILSFHEAYYEPLL